MNAEPRQRPDRDDKTLLAIHAHKPVRRAVNVLAAEQDTTNVALIYEAVGLLLTKHGKPVPSEIETELVRQQRQKLCTAHFLPDNVRCAITMIKALADE